MSTDEPIVIVGAGISGTSAARAIASHAPPGGVVVLGEEGVAPYDRTTLSKPAVLGGGTPPSIWPDSDELLDKVDLRVGHRVVGVDCAGRAVVLDSGETLSYRSLVLATGARARTLGGDWAGVPGVHSLRTWADARELRAELERSTHVAVVGGGVIGLELAASARQLGHEVTVVEAAPRLLGRYLPDSIVTTVADRHRAAGVRLIIGMTPVRPGLVDGHVRAIELNDGQTVKADLVIVGIGSIPRVEVAVSAGLLVDDGIVVDQDGRTSDPDIYAVGDVAHCRGYRSESWYPAADQGTAVAAHLVGLGAAPGPVPWTWSDQFDLTIQVAGRPASGATSHRFDGDDRQLVLEEDEGVLTAAYSVAPGTSLGRAMLAARALLARGWSLPRDMPTDLDGVVGVLTKAAKDARRHELTASS